MVMLILLKKTHLVQVMVIRKNRGVVIVDDFKKTFKDMHSVCTKGMTSLRWDCLETQLHFWLVYLKQNGTKLCCFLFLKSAYENKNLE